MAPVEFRPESVIEAVRSVSFERLHDEMLSIDQNAGYCYWMNPTGARIWEKLSRPVSVGALCSALCAEFSIDRETCFRDLVEFLSGMYGAGLIRIGNVEMA